MTTIEKTLCKVIKTSHISWRPFVEILKEEGLQVDASQDSSFDTAFDGMNDLR